MFDVLPSPIASLHEQIVIAPHHPDRLRRPPVRPGAVEEERFEQTLAWNVFRTLELLPPAFWLRRLHARLGGHAFPPAAQTVRVDLWQPLRLPPAQRIDGSRPDVVVDVVIETEHAVWTLMICGTDSLRCFESDGSGSDAMARVIDAGSWHAGTRPCYAGIVQPAAAASPVARLVQRYSRSTHSLGIRSGARASVPRNIHGVGVLHWTDLEAILRDSEGSLVLTAIERALAGNALTWLRAVGTFANQED